METTLTLQNGTVLYADSSEQPSLAPLMLAHFAAPGNGKRVAEFCAGNGCCSFWLLDRGFRGETVLVDLRPEPLELAEKTARANGFDGVSVLRADVASYRGGKLFDAVLCNPPFFSERDAAGDPDRNAVRHENGLETLYYNLASVQVQEGDAVTASTCLGLRLPLEEAFMEVRRSGRAIDPSALVTPREDQP